MSENKFIQHLKGKDTAKSVLEVKNQATPTSFANMPTGTSDGSVVYSDHRGNATAVLKGTDNWKLSGSTLVSATTVYGDGRDLTSSFLASGNTLWVNATYTFANPQVFTANTKWVLKLCGHSLDSSVYNEIPFSLVVKIGNSIITKQFNVREEAFEFCKEFVIDFAESETAILHANTGDTMNVQLLCGDASASATIYNGMSVLTALQRRVDGDAISSNTRNFDELEEDFDDLKEDYDQFVIDTGTALDGKVNIDGTSIMTAPLKFRAGSMRGAVGPYLNGVSFWKLDSQGNITNIANLTDSQFLPVTTNAIDLGRSANKWKDLYLAGKAYMSVINNGYDIAVPVTNSADTLALKSEVDLAANSGRMITDQGVWYAKMYAATVAPAAEDGTNYADFSQTDGQGNPIIVIYSRVSGAWVQDQTITPPAEYDGYVPITSKIWDIAEQAGQQGGRILWNHQSKEFTPYPQIISFEDIEVTGNSTVVMPLNPSTNQIVNKDYVDNAIGNGTITLTQGGTTKGTFTTNQSGDTTIDLDAGGGSSNYHPDLFDWKWSDALRNDVQWLRADTFSWQAGSVYKAAYKHLRNDMYIWASWDNNGTTIYTKKRYPEVGEKAYTNSSLTTELGEITAIADSLSDEQITVNGVVYDMLSGSNIAPTTETVAGVTVQYIPAEDGHKIVTDFHTTEVESVYAATGEAWYYIIDYGFYRFKLPRKRSRQIVESVVNNDGSWYRLYADGWIEQGGKHVSTGTNPQTITLLKQMADTNYSILDACYYTNTGSTSLFINANNKTQTSFQWYGGNTSTGLYWQVSGKSNIDMSQYQANEKYLYFYVGSFTQSAIENTAGLNAELFDDKADVDLNNVSAGIDFVVESQLPTAANNYTWFRKYKSGWVEQGGKVSTPNSGSATVNLPVTMSDANYTINATGTSTVGGGDYQKVGWSNQTSTGFKIYSAGGGGSYYANTVYWQVSGKVA